jgi:hypothetical protein
MLVQSVVSSLSILLLVVLENVVLPRRRGPILGSLQLRTNASVRPQGTTGRKFYRSPIHLWRHRHLRKRSKLIFAMH